MFFFSLHLLINGCLRRALSAFHTRRLRMFVSLGMTHRVLCAFALLVNCRIYGEGRSCKCLRLENAYWGAPESPPTEHGEWTLNRTSPVCCTGCTLLPPKWANWLSPIGLILQPEPPSRLCFIAIRWDSRTATARPANDHLSYSIAHE